MTESFADTPKSIGEIRVEKNDNADDWTVRDCLISLLRDIDSKKIDLKSCVVVYMKGDDKIGYTRVDKTFAGSILLLESIKISMIKDWMK